MTGPYGGDGDGFGARGRLCVRPYPPVCALGTSPEGGSKESESRERGARDDREEDRKTE